MAQRPDRRDARAALQRYRLEGVRETGEELGRDLMRPSSQWITRECAVQLKRFTASSASVEKEIDT